MIKETERHLVVKQRDKYYKVSTVWTNEELATLGTYEVISQHGTPEEALTSARVLNITSV